MLIQRESTKSNSTLDSTSLNKKPHPAWKLMVKVAVWTEEVITEWLITYSIHTTFILVPLHTEHLATSIQFQAKSSLAGQTYSTFLMGKPMIVNLLIMNSQPISSSTTSNRTDMTSGRLGGLNNWIPLDIKGSMANKHIATRQFNKHLKNPDPFTVGYWIYVQ